MTDEQFNNLMKAWDAAFERDMKIAERKLQRELLLGRAIVDDPEQRACQYDHDEHYHRRDCYGRIGTGD